MGPLRASLTRQLTALRGDAPDALVDAVVEDVSLPGGPVQRARPRSFDDVREAEALAGPGRPTPCRGGCRDFLAAARSRWRTESMPDPAQPDRKVHRLTRRAGR